MKQFKAGYILDAISNLITDNFKSLNYFNEKENDDINKIKGYSAKENQLRSQYEEEKNKNIRDINEKYV